MPRRTVTPATPAPSAPLPPPPRDLSTLAQSDPQWAANLHTLRHHWKWANFSQFFYTFAPLLAMPDVFLSDVEDDLARDTNLYLPRLMHRLLYTLSQDRKLNIDNWQTALRRQYLRRDPAANPIGPEPQLPSRESSATPSDRDEEDGLDDATESQSKPIQELTDDNAEEIPDAAHSKGESSSETKIEPAEDAKVPNEDAHKQPSKVVEEEESKDWLELPMLEKLESLHTLIEWQFQTPLRLRHLIKDDDDGANWRIEPIGYDAKTNAYWLIGPDRLWIQRAPPRPPRNRNLKRKRPTTTPKKPATRSKVTEPSSDDEDDGLVAPSKRTRIQSRPQPRSQPQTNGRSTRSSRRSANSSGPGPASNLIPPVKSIRTAKMQANKKLDAQARELAEFQRQTAALARSPRRASASASPAKRALGTRMSARIRNATRGEDEDEDDEDDDEWQQVPEEWLQESATPQRRSRARTRSKGKAKAETEDDEPEEGARYEVEDAGASSDKEMAEGGEEKGDEQDAEEGEDAADNNALLQKAGLESGNVSDLTDLSDPQGSDGGEGDDGPPARIRRSTRKTGGRKFGRRTRNTKTRSQREPISKRVEIETKSQEDEEMDEPPAPSLPTDFVEWEAIAITLTEWEHVADPFEKATHYLEKALYKMLAQNIIPIVTADLREAEKRRRMEEAVVHRKRSSRIAIKESEKEEARAAAKKKAEEEDKLARARRQEARQKKEEAERAKRERARDQRAKEREEREARARAKAERAEREEAARSTATPSVNGTQQSSSLQPSRMVTPNGVRTPDWVLDCEICHKQGVNMDDGHAMVSCASCNRWQHIGCHDHSDQRAGRPRRDWEKQQFYCIRCRQRALSGSVYGGQAHQSHAMHQQPYGWTQGGRPALPLQKPGSIDPYVAPSDLRYSHRSPIENGSGYSQQQYMSNNAGTAPYSRSSYPSAGLSFNHYQPDQRGTSSRAVPTTSQASWSGSSNGYSPVAEQMSGRMQSSHFVPPYAHNGGVYASNRIPSAYQSQPSTSPVGQYGTSTHDPLASVSSSRWPTSTSNGYRAPASSAVQEAAQSLTFMHDSNSRYNGSSWPASSSYAQASPTSSHGHHSAYSHTPTQSNVDPLTGHGFPTARTDQHFGHSLPHTNGAASFNLPR